MDDDDDDDDDRDDYGARAGDESKNESDKSTESLCQVQVSKQLKWVKNSSEATKATLPCHSWSLQTCSLQKESSDIARSWKHLFRFASFLTILDFFAEHIFTCLS